MDDVLLYPAWKQAKKDLRVRGLLDAGAVISKEVLTGMLGIREATTIEQYQRNQFEFLRGFDALRTSLLEDDNVMLRAVPGIGYEVIPPAAQTERAVQDRMHRIKKEVKKMYREIAHVDREALTDQQRTDNANAIAKAGQFAALVRRTALPNLG